MLVGDQMPWWLGRGVGVALLLAMGAVVWACAWDVATYASTTRVSAAQPSESAKPVSSTVPVAKGLPAEQPPPVDPPASDAFGGTDSSRAGQRAEQPTAPTAHERALAAQAAQKREQARARRAARSDRELAAFIAAVGVPEEADLWVKPLSAAYRITASFGQAGSRWSRDHTGVDLAAPSGTPVASVAAGTVTHAGRAGAYGLKVEVTHADGTETWYAHLSRIDVAVGQSVEQGGSLGAVGSTGNSTGPHLHVELRPGGGGPVDPVEALAARGVHL